MPSLKKYEIWGLPRYKRMIKYCIFDLDGTLFDTLVTITHYVNEILTRHNIGRITVDDCSRFIGHGAKTLIKRSLSSCGVEDEELAERYLPQSVAAYRELYAIVQARTSQDLQADSRFCA